jgi:hypothetical protein
MNTLVDPAQTILETYASMLVSRRNESHSRTVAPKAKIFATFADPRLIGYGDETIERARDDFGTGAVRPFRQEDAYVEKEIRKLINMEHEGCVFGTIPAKSTKDAGMLYGQSGMCVIIQQKDGRHFTLYFGNDFSPRAYLLAAPFEIAQKGIDPKYASTTYHVERFNGKPEPFDTEGDDTDLLDWEPYARFVENEVETISKENKLPPHVFGTIVAMDISAGDKKNLPVAHADLVSVVAGRYNGANWSPLDDPRKVDALACRNNHRIGDKLNSLLMNAVAK